MPCIYVLKSNLNNKLYIGSFRDDEPNERVTAHNAGKVRSTKSRKPWELIHIERYNTYTETRKRELFLKSGRGRSLLQQILS